MIALEWVRILSLPVVAAIGLLILAVLAEIESRDSD